MKWEFAICPKDEPDLASGHKRKKRGDIVAVKPYPWSWGAEELKRYLILVVNNLTEEEISNYMSPYYENGIEPTTNNAAAITAKRRFKVDLDQIKKYIKPDMDISSLEDFSIAYQPLKDSGIEIDADTLPEEIGLVTDKFTGNIKKAKKH